MPFIFNGKLELFNWGKSCKINYFFILLAAWKIIRNWLPAEAVKLIKFCDKKNIREYIQESQLFVHMGGTVIKWKKLCRALILDLKTLNLIRTISDTRMTSTIILTSRIQTRKIPGYIAASISRRLKSSSQRVNWV